MNNVPGSSVLSDQFMVTLSEERVLTRHDITMLISIN